MKKAVKITFAMKPPALAPVSPMLQATYVINVKRITLIFHFATHVDVMQKVARMLSAMSSLETVTALNMSQGNIVTNAF